MAEIPLSKTTKFIVDNRGRTAPTASSGIPLIATNCISNRNLYPVYENVRYVSKETYANWFRSHPEPNDIILTLKGSQNGAVCLVPNPVDFAIAQDMVALRADENVIYPLFLFAALKYEDVQQQIKNLDVSGVIPHFKKSDFDKLLLPYPDKNIQKFIGDFYYNFSKKIDFLHRQNKTLEALAETLFRQWFVEEAEESWEKGKIGDVLKTELGGTPSTAKPEYWDGDIAWINSGEVNKFRIVEASRFITKEGMNNSNCKLLPKGTTVLAITGATLGQISLLEIETCANQSVVGIIPNQRIPKEFVFLWIKHKIEEIILNETGGAQPHINKNDVNAAEIILPPEQLIKEKLSPISDYFDKITKNVFQIRTLTTLRDMLLPKLMSGELGVELSKSESATANK